MLSLNCKRDWNGVPIIDKAGLDEYADASVTDFDPSLTAYPRSVDVERMIEFYLQAYLEIRPITAANSILGATVFKAACVPVYDSETCHFTLMEVPDRTVLIEQGIYNTLEPGRYNFTMAHEAGHLFLHDADGDTRYRQVCDNTSFLFRFEQQNYARKEARSPRDWMEWQADYFASALLMPRSTVPTAIEGILFDAGVLGGEYGRRAVCRTPELYAHVVYQLSRIYRVSRTAASIRMRDFGYIRP